MVESGGQVSFDHWLQIGVGWAVFGFFGFGKDAVEMYRGWVRAMGLGGVLDKFDHWRRSRRGDSGEKSVRWGSTVSSAASEMGHRWGSVSSRAKLLFHNHNSDDYNNAAAEKRHSETAG